MNQLLTYVCVYKGFSFSLYYICGGFYLLVILGFVEVMFFFDFLWLIGMFIVYRYMKVKNNVCKIKLKFKIKNGVMKLILIVLSL